MKNRQSLFFMGVLVLTLTLGTVLAGCQNPSDSGTGNGGNGNGTDTGGSNPFVGTWTGTVPLANRGSTAVTLTVTDSNWTLTASEDGWGIANGTYQRSGSNATLMVDGSSAGSASVSGNSLTFNINDGSSNISGSLTKNGGGDGNGDGGGDGNGDGNGNGGGDTTTKPGAPTGVTATALSSSSISVTWNAVSGADSYKVYYEKGSSDDKILAGTANGTSYTHTGLDANTTYYYYIKAVNSAGESGYSSASSAKTPSSGGDGDTSVPDSPTLSGSITGSGSSGRAFKINFVFSSTVTNIKIEGYAQNVWTGSQYVKGWKVITTLSGDKTSYSLPESSWGTYTDDDLVQIRVSGENSIGYGQTSQISYDRRFGGIYK